MVPHTLGSPASVAKGDAMTQTRLSLFPDPKVLLALEPEDLGGVLLAWCRAKLRAH
jgi:hypothetical protein